VIDFNWAYAKAWLIEAIEEPAGEIKSNAKGIDGLPTVAFQL
jgi:hypothetical protein